MALEQNIIQKQINFNSAWFQKISTNSKYHHIPLVNIIGDIKLKLRNQHYKSCGRK